MKAIVLKAIGDPENLVLMEVPQPVFRKDEVLVKVKAISINPVDAFVRQNEEALKIVYQLHSTEPFIILGWDISGIVIAVGEEVTKFKIGDEVFGMLQIPGQANAYAEYVAAKAVHLTSKPINISFEEAAGASLAALAAWQSVVTNGQISKGDKIIIHGASGGVGHFAVQIAKNFGAYVVAVGTTVNKGFIMGLGANEFIDYERQKFEEIVSDADLVHDAVWSDDVNHIERSLKAIKPGGTLLSLVVDFNNSMIRAMEERKVTGKRVYVVHNEDDLASIADLLAKGSIKTHVSKTFSLEEMPKAHTLIQTKKAIGKIIVRP